MVRGGVLRWSGDEVVEGGVVRAQVLADNHVQAGTVSRRGCIHLCICPRQVQCIRSYAGRWTRCGRRSMPGLAERRCAIECGRGA